MLKDLFKSQKKPNNVVFPTPPTPQDVQNNLDGIQCEKDGDEDAAIKMYEQNIAQGFDGDHPYKRLAIIYRKRKMYDDEVRVLEKAVDVFSKIKRQDAPKKLEYFKDRLQKAKELQKGK